MVLNAVAARESGALIETRHALVEGQRTDGGWALTVADAVTGERKTRRAKILVNAAGPWVGTVLGEALRSNAPARVRLVKGSHIVVRKLFDHDRCYIFQNADGRIVFAIPYERDFTLIGTTDIEFTGDPSTVEASADEIGYLCAVANEYFSRTTTPDDVVWSFAGVRPLYDDGASAAQEATRDYVLVARCRRRTRAAAQRLRRQDHDISSSCGSGARQAECSHLPASRAWTREADIARRRFSDAGFCRTRRGACRALA